MRIKKVSQTTSTQAQVVDGYSTSTTDSYSCNYENDMNTYSTDEKRIGTWINSKPIYRKVIVLESGTIQAGYYEYNHNISNLDKVLNIRGFCYSSTQQHPIQRVVPDEIAKWGIGLGDITQSKFALHFGTGYLNITLVYIIIEYTKTTD